MTFFMPAPRDARGPAWAGELARVLSRARKITRSPDLSEWGREFTRLNTKVAEARISRVLAWYGKNLLEPHTPRAYSARLFRVKFEQIEQAMVESESVTGLDELEIGAHACRVASRLGLMPWPCEVEALLPALVQGSLDRFTLFRRACASHHAGSNRDARFLAHVLEARLHCDFVELGWFGLWQSRVGFREHFTGALSVLVFEPTSAVFRQSIWHAWALGWCRSATAFDPLLEAVTEAKP